MEDSAHAVPAVGTITHHTISATTFVLCHSSNNNGNRRRSTSRNRSRSSDNLSKDPDPKPCETMVALFMMVSVFPAALVAAFSSQNGINAGAKVRGTRQA